MVKRSQLVYLSTLGIHPYMLIRVLKDIDVRLHKKRGQEIPIESVPKSTIFELDPFVYERMAKLISKRRSAVRRNYPRRETQRKQTEERKKKQEEEKEKESSQDNDESPPPSPPPAEDITQQLGDLGEIFISSDEEGKEEEEKKKEMEDALNRVFEEEEEGYSTISEGVGDVEQTEEEDENYRDMFEDDEMALGIEMRTIRALPIPLKKRALRATKRRLDLQKQMGMELESFPEEIGDISESEMARILNRYYARKAEEQEDFSDNSDIIGRDLARNRRVISQLAYEEMKIENRLRQQGKETFSDVWNEFTLKIHKEQEEESPPNFEEQWEKFLDDFNYEILEQEEPIREEIIKQLEERSEEEDDTETEEENVQLSDIYEVEQVPPAIEPVEYTIPPRTSGYEARTRPIVSPVEYSTLTRKSFQPQTKPTSEIEDYEQFPNISTYSRHNVPRIAPQTIQKSGTFTVQVLPRSEIEDYERIPINVPKSVPILKYVKEYKPMEEEIKIPRRDNPQLNPERIEKQSSNPLKLKEKMDNFMKSRGENIEIPEIPTKRKRKVSFINEPRQQYERSLRDYKRKQRKFDENSRKYREEKRRRKEEKAAIPLTPEQEQERKREKEEKKKRKETSDYDLAFFFNRMGLQSPFAFNEYERQQESFKAASTKLQITPNKLSSEPSNSTLRENLDSPLSINLRIYINLPANIQRRYLTDVLLAEAQGDETLFSQLLIYLNRGVIFPMNHFKIAEAILRYRFPFEQVEKLENENALEGFVRQNAVKMQMNFKDWFRNLMNFYLSKVPRYESDYIRDRLRTFINSESDIPNHSVTMPSKGIIQVDPNVTNTQFIKIFVFLLNLQQFKTILSGKYTPPDDMLRIKGETSHIEFYPRTLRVVRDPIEEEKSAELELEILEMLTSVLSCNGSHEFYDIMYKNYESEERLNERIGETITQARALSARILSSRSSLPQTRKNTYIQKIKRCIKTLQDSLGIDYSTTIYVYPSNEPVPGRIPETPPPSPSRRKTDEPSQSQKD